MTDAERQQVRRETIEECACALEKESTEIVDILMGYSRSGDHTPDKDETAEEFLMSLMTYVVATRRVRELLDRPPPTAEEVKAAAARSGRLARIVTTVLAMQRAKEKEGEKN